jgi:hypothetical protein
MTPSAGNSSVCHPEAKPKDLRLFLVTFHPASSAPVTRARKIDSVIRNCNDLVQNPAPLLLIIL